MALIEFQKEPSICPVKKNDKTSEYSYKSGGFMSRTEQFIKFLSELKKGKPIDFKRFDLVFESIVKEGNDIEFYKSVKALEESLDLMSKINKTSDQKKVA